VKIILNWFYDFLLRIKEKISLVEYSPPKRKKTQKEWELEYSQLNTEADEFIRKVGNRGPFQWNIAEIGWYESIRYRELEL